MHALLVELDGLACTKLNFMADSEIVSLSVSTSCWSGDGFLGCLQSQTTSSLLSGLTLPSFLRGKWPSRREEIELTSVGVLVNDSSSLSSDILQTWLSRHTRMCKSCGLLFPVTVVRTQTSAERSFLDEFVCLLCLSYWLDGGYICVCVLVSALVTYS